MRCVHKNLVQAQTQVRSLSHWQKGAHNQNTLFLFPCVCVLIEQICDWNEVIVVMRWSLRIIQPCLAFHVEVGPDERYHGDNSFAVKLKGE